MQCGSCNAVLPDDAMFCAACGQPIAGAVGPKAGKAITSKWLVVVFVALAMVGVLFFGGIIAAIAIPNLLNAIDRGKQKRTMADMRSIAAAIESYRVDNRTYPEASDVESLRSKLEPAYIHALPTRDGWGQRFILSSDGSTYQLISEGKDGARDGCDGGKTNNFRDDICLLDGEFTQWPDGVQR